VKRLDTLKGGALDSADLAVGFEFRGERIPLIVRIAPRPSACAHSMLGHAQSCVLSAEIAVFVDHQRAAMRWTQRD
jgi:hypothetical protein